MGKFANPKQLKKKLKEIVKKTRANNRRHKQNKNVNTLNQSSDENKQNNTNKNRNNNNKKKQFRGVWRYRKGGKRVYIGLDGNEYDGKEARKKCIIDKQTLEKLQETKRQLQSPSFQYAMNNSNSNNNNNNIKSSLNYWQIPHEIVRNYSEKGINKLFDWQIECLSLLNHNDINANNNLLYCAPTSGGKTLVSEILMIRRILLYKKKCLLILPFVSLVIEKVNDLKSKFECLGILVSAYHSNISINSIEDCDIIICTIEKANSIINKMFEEELISLIGCCIIDEFHYIGDKYRGWILEILLTKLLFISLIKNYNIQIIGMSATLPNLNDICQWLNAKLYITNIRPIKLTQYYKYKNILYNAEDTPNKQIRKLKQIHINDKQHVVTLCLEIINKNASVLVFCEKKIWCKQCCKMITQCLKEICNQNNNQNKINLSLINKRKMLIEQLKELPMPICNVLNESILYGIGYHHAGLTLEEREIIENGFRKNILNVLVATSTLAAGVNLPARRVIFRTPKVGRNFLNPSKYKQMSGRAGRKGIDLYGESIVICSNENECKYVLNNLINAKLEPIKSQLLNDNNLSKFILEGFGTNLINNVNDLNKYLNLSLQFTEIEINNKTEWENQCKISLNWLIQNSFINKKEIGEIIENENETFEITNLGYATIGSGLNPYQSLLVFEEINKTRKYGLHLTNSLHLCYLLAPIRNNGGNVNPNWEYYYEYFMCLSNIKKEIAKSICISEKILSDFAHNISIRPKRDSKNKLHIKYKRFYCAIILNQIIEEKSLYQIEKRFNIDSGKMQSLQTSSASFANSLSVFCMKLNWNCMAQIFAHFSQRLNYGCESELLPLMKINNMKPFRARILYQYGLTTIQDIVDSSLETIILALSSQSKFSTNNMHKTLMVQNAQKIKYEANSILTRQNLMNDEQDDD